MQSFTRLLLLAEISLICLHHVIDATSIKMDFLPVGDVRTDPIINPGCLSDHVHTYYGVNKMRPETTYDDLRNADGNTGNVVENKSIYWHPTVYKVEENGVYKKADIYFTSAYYIWTTGQATAFPDGFKMIAGFLGVKEARADFECAGGSICSDKDDEEACIFKEFPMESCAELEVSMAFPTCWDGVNIDSEDHMSHVSYDIEGGRFDGDCPKTHPIKLPEIQLFFRILPYPGGKHVFSDGTSFYHADYFSGWDNKELQNVLDNCENDSDAASPDAWCENFLTFRDAPKVLGEDDLIVTKLKTFQPDPFDTTTITDEVIDNTSQLPRGACTGTLKPEGPTPAPTPTPTARLTPTTIPSSSPAGSPPSGKCHVQEFLGSTIYLPLAGSCFKIEFFPDGVIAADATDPDCAKKVHTSSLVVSNFHGFDKNGIYFVSSGAKGYNGKFEFEEDDLLSELSAIPRQLPNDNNGQSFILGLIYPSCYQGPMYPVYYKLLQPQISFPVLGYCVRAQLYQGGVLSLDATDGSCTNPVFTESINVSVFNSGHGNEAFFSALSNNGWDGRLEFYRDTTATDIDVKRNKLDTTEKKFDLVLTLPPSYFP